MSHSPSGRPTRFSLIALLYVSQSIPLGFFIVAMPAILRERGLSLQYVGLLSVIALPWLIKFLWAPLLDRFGSRRFGHFRSWIVPLQSLSVLIVLLIAAIDLETQMMALVAAGAVFMMISATQDIATDGLAVRSLRPEERGPGNGIQVGGYYLGQVLGGGVTLFVFSRFGWAVAVVAMAAFLALPLFPALLFREGTVKRIEHPRIDFGAIVRFFRRSGGSTWLAILLLYRAAEAMALTMINPMLVDMGFTLGQIGALMGIAGSIASLAGALTGGMLILRLGRKPSLVVFGTLQAAAVGLLMVPAAAGASAASPAGVYAVVVAVAFTGGMATAALYTNMMDRAQPQTAATDFTVQQSVCAIGPLMGSALSGFSAATFGYGGHFLACAVVGAISVAVIVRWLAESVPVISPVAADAGCSS